CDTGVLHGAIAIPGNPLEVSACAVFPKLRLVSSLVDIVCDGAGKVIDTAAIRCDRKGADGKVHRCVLHSRRRAGNTLHRLGTVCTIHDCNIKNQRLKPGHFITSVSTEQTPGATSSRSCVNVSFAIV